MYRIHVRGSYHIEVASRGRFFNFFRPEALVRPKFTTKCSQYMVTSALISRRLKFGVANFLVHQWIEQQSSLFFAAGIEKLVPRWDKCLNVLGGYVEK